MKKYLLTLFSAGLFLLALHVGLFFTQLGVETESSRWIHDALELKRNRALSIEGPKLLLIAGSGTLYSFEAEALERRLKIPTVNCGLHAGLGVEYILHAYSDLVKKGDIVVLPLEYVSYHYDGNTSATLADFASSRDPAWIIQSPAVFFNTAFSFSFSDLILRNRKRFKPDRHWVGHYDVTYLSAHGDKTNTGKELITKQLSDELDTYKPMQLRPFSQDSAAVKVISSFIRHCQNQGAEVFLTFPVTLNYPEYQYSNFVETVRQRVTHFQTTGVEILGNPDDFLFPREMFFNTFYHSNADGRALGTRKLGDLLEPHLKHLNNPEPAKTSAATPPGS